MALYFYGAGLQGSTHIAEQPGGSASTLLTQFNECATHSSFDAASLQVEDSLMMKLTCWTVAAGKMYGKPAAVLTFSR